MQRLEEIDDDADQHKIGFVKIQDKHLAFEYGLESMPALVYYRKKIPIVYEGKNERRHSSCDVQSTCCVIYSLPSLESLGDKRLMRSH